MPIMCIYHVYVQCLSVGIIVEVKSFSIIITMQAYTNNMSIGYHNILLCIIKYKPYTSFILKLWTLTPIKIKLLSGLREHG